MMNVFMINLNNNLVYWKLKKDKFAEYKLSALIQTDFIDARSYRPVEPVNRLRNY